LYSGKIWRTNVHGEQNFWDLTQATKWSGDQVVKKSPGGQMSGELMAGDQMTGELMS
jgi:hypothetical protein